MDAFSLLFLLFLSFLFLFFGSFLGGVLNFRMDAAGISVCFLELLELGILRAWPLCILNFSMKRLKCMLFFVCMCSILYEKAEMVHFLEIFNQIVHHQFLFVKLCSILVPTIWEGCMYLHEKKITETVLQRCVFLRLCWCNF